MRRYELKFWITLLALNFLLFLPQYITNIDTSAFLPVSSFTTGTGIEIYNHIFRRFNYDIFRISVDLFALILIYYSLKKKISPIVATYIICIYYVVIFLFLIYYNIFYKIYLIKPLLLSDLYLFKLAFYNVGGKTIVIIFSTVIVLGGIIYGIFKAVKLLVFYTSKVKFSLGSTIIFIVLGLLLIINSIKLQWTFEPRHEFQLTTALIVDNFKLSTAATNELRSVNWNGQRDIALLTKYRLKEKPDVYLIFIESYGNILNQSDKLVRDYYECLARCDSIFRENGWKSTSILSTSPVSGGRSWLSYTSVIFGIKITQQSTYIDLQKNANAARYPHFIRYLKNNGYTTIWLNSIPDRKNMNIPWELYTRFYDIDKWIRFKDLNYQGKLYGFGPSPPDQYTLFYARDLLKNYSGTPHFMFYITQNTHNPFYSPDSIVNNWSDLNTGESADMNMSKSVFLQKPSFENYLHAVKYDLETITRFISQCPNHNSIFILIGDHQPPILSTINSGFETPVHIIATDSSFISSFKDSGFEPGLHTEGTNAVRHEDLYSIILKELVKNFGSYTEGKELDRHPKLTSVNP